MPELEQAAAKIRELNSRWPGLGRADLWVTTFARWPPGRWPLVTGYLTWDLNQSSGTSAKVTSIHTSTTPGVRPRRRANRMYFVLDSNRSWSFFIIIKNTKNTSSLTFDLALVLAIKSLSSSERKEIHLRWPSGQGRYLSATWVRRQER